MSIYIVAKGIEKLLNKCIYCNEQNCVYCHGQNGSLKCFTRILMVSDRDKLAQLKFFDAANAQQCEDIFHTFKQNSDTHIDANLLHDLNLILELANEKKMLVGPENESLRKLHKKYHYVLEYHKWRGF